MSLFNPLVPTGLLNLDVDYKNIQNNMQQLDTSFGVDHIPFSTTPNNGKHKKVTLIVQPDPTPTLGQGVAYCKAAGFASEAQLFWTFAGLGTPLQITGSQFATGATNGYVPLMNGLLLQWGVIATVGAVTPVTFNTLNVNFTTNCFIVNVTPNVAAVNNSQQFTILSKTINGFVLGTNSGYAIGSNFFWWALGN